MMSAPHRLTATDTSGKWQSAKLHDVQPGTRDVELRFRENRYVDVAARAGSSPVARFAVVTRDETGTTMLEGTGNLVSEDGRARLRVPTQRFLVEVVAPRYAISRQGPFDPAAPPGSLEFDLSPEAGI